MSEKENKRQIAKISIFITSLFVIFLSVTYAFMNMTLVGTRRQVITAGNLELELLEDENNLAIENALPMYDEVGMIQDPFTFRLVNKAAYPAEYILKLENITVSGGLLDIDVKYGLTKDKESTIAFVSDIEEGIIDSGTINGNATIQYSLRLWIRDDLTEFSRIQNKAMRFRMDISANPSTKVEEVPIGKVVDLPFAEENLGEACKTYNDGIDTFLVGQCQNNYVWYSGKLWRIVLKNNETGNIKMITENGIVSIYNNALYDTTFENSYVDQWLNQEFLPTLHDYEDYIVTDSMWDATLNETNQPSRPNGSIMVNRAIGFLNSYENYATFGHSDGIATYSTGYLRNDMPWFLINPITNVNIACVTSDGQVGGTTSGNISNVRPVVNLKKQYSNCFW